MLKCRIASGATMAVVCALAIAGQTRAQMFPVAATGWNRDVVVENTATVPYSSFAQAFDVFNGWSWYERGLAGSTKGLPQGGAFTSIADGTTLGQFQPYNGPNALFLDATTPTGTLTLAPAAQQAYNALAVFASSSNQGGVGTLVVTFTDASTSASIPLNAQDWFNVTTNNALNDLGRANLNDGTFDDGSAGNPRIYQTTIDMVALGLNTRVVASIAFTKPAVGDAAQNTVVMGISGQPASNAPGACCAPGGTCALATQPNCLSPNLFQGPGSACSGAGGTCPAVASACCNTTSGVCVYTGGTTCASGFTNLGAGSSCLPNPCPQTGACCANSGACTPTNAAGCAAPSLFQGLGTACGAGATCPVATGACCNGLFASCVFVVGTSCPSGFAFSGPGTVCSPNTCVGLPSVCENLDSTAPGSLPAGWNSIVATGVGAPWAVTNAQSHTPSNSVATNDVASVSDQQLTLPTVTAAGNLTLDLWSRFLTEGTFASGPWYDGWVVEVAYDGVTFSNIGAAAWTLNGYNAAAISAAFASPIAGQPAFSGTAATWTERTAVIPANSGDQVTIRFRMASDNSVSPANSGVWLDDVCIANILVPATGVCCRGATCTTTVTTGAACTGSLIGGQTAGAAFVTTSSTCNSAPVSSTPCCYANYNQTGGITVQDIFDFLSDWFAGSPYAKTGGTGAPGPLSVQNIFDFLSNWFNGGC